MSHTTTIGQILFADRAALQSAAEELKSRGVRCDLIEAAIPRAYYANQMEQAELVLKLHDSRYDVGFYPSQEDDSKLEARCDLWGGDVAGQIGAPVEEGINESQAAIGQLQNAYVHHAAVNRFAPQGAMVSRQDNDDGSYELTVTVAA